MGVEFCITHADGDLFDSVFSVSLVLILPVITKLCGTRRAYLILSLIQVFIMGFNPVVSTLNTIPYENQITLLYCVIASFHVVRSVLFKYLFKFKLLLVD